MNLQSDTVSEVTWIATWNGLLILCLWQYTKNKGFCEDLTEGKFSFPIIHAIRADSSNRQLLNIVSQKPTSVEVKQYALEIIGRTGTFEYVREFLSKKEMEARKEIEMLGGNPLLEKVMDMLVISK